MRLARIEHWRCDQPISWRGGGGYTYVWVDDDMTEEELDALCEAAQNSYLEAEREIKAATPIQPPGYGATIQSNTPDTKTVGELKAEYETQAKTYKEYQEKVQDARQSFAYWLTQHHGKGRIKLFWEEKAALNVQLNWGHNHGVTIEHSPTNIGDYPFPEDSGDDL